MNNNNLSTFIDNLIRPSDKRNRIVVIWTLVFFTIAHAFRWFNTAYNHDSLKVYQLDGHLQVFLGRFLVPSYLLFRGKIASPFLIALITAVFMVLATILMVRVLDLKKPVHIISFCALTATCPVLISLFSTFISATDIHILALLFATLSVYVFFEFKRGWILGALFLVCSLALYQAYAQVAVTLILMCIIRDVLVGDDLKGVWNTGKKAALLLLIGAALYFIGYVLYVKLVHGLDLSQLPSNGSYNSLDGMTHLKITDIPGLFRGAYVFFFHRMVKTSSSFLLRCGVANLLILASAFLFIFRSEASAKRKIIAVLLSLFLPLAANFVFILSRGVVHTLMVFSFIVLYGGALAMMELQGSEDGEKDWPTYAARVVAIAAMVFLVRANVVSSNALYVRKSLEEQATLSVMSRLLGTIESIEGYKPGETEVVFVGDLNKSSIRQVRSGYPKRNVLLEFKSFSVTYYKTYSDYFQNVLGYPLKLMEPDISKHFSEMEEVAAMPSFPSPGCARMIGDVLVVRLSEEME